MARKREYRRWVTIGCDDPFGQSLAKAKLFGLEVRAGGKPGMVAWYGLLLFGTAEQMKSLEAWWISKKIEWFMRKPAGAWPI